MTGKQRQFKRLWHYSTKLKEGGKAWDKVMFKLEKLKKEITGK